MRFTFLRRMLTLALCLLFPMSALADGVRFCVSADMDPVQYSEELQPLMKGISALMDTSEIQGTFITDGSSFDLLAELVIPDGEDALRTDLHLWGVDSHWGVDSSLLGHTSLMINHLALLEFGVKTYNHLGFPLQRACLLVPYAHTSAWDALRPSLSPLLPPENGERHIALAELQSLCTAIAELAETDRTIRCWIEAIGIESGADMMITEALWALPTALESLCPEGLTVLRSDDCLTWIGGDTTFLSLSTEERTTSLTLHLPGLGTVGASIRDDLTILTGTLTIESVILSADAAFSLPTSLPVTLPFFLTLNADGLLVGEQPVHIVLEGEAHGNTLTIRQMLPDLSRTMMTISAVLTPFEPDSLPSYTASDINGVNVLSSTGDSLHALMAQIKAPMLTGLFRLVATAPAETCQAVMDVLEDSGILGLLSDAMMGASNEY